MKRVCIVVLLVFLLCLFMGCNAGGKSEDVSSLVGKWKGADIMEETYEFKADGTGHNENALLSFDFKYNTDGDKLNIYAELFGMESDEAMTYTYSINGDRLTLVDEASDTTYEYTRS